MKDPVGLGTDFVSPISPNSKSFFTWVVGHGFASLLSKKSASSIHPLKCMVAGLHLNIFIIVKKKKKGKL